MKRFYRVSNIITEQGLWYDFNGIFTGLIHEPDFNFCKNRSIQMPYDENLVGWLSATDSIEDLYNWFSQEDIIKLQERGFFIHEYEVKEFKNYLHVISLFPLETAPHYIINKDTSVPVRRYVLYNL